MTTEISHAVGSIHVSGQGVFPRFIQAPSSSSVACEVLSKEQAHPVFNSVTYDMCPSPAFSYKNLPCSLTPGSENMAVCRELLPVDNRVPYERKTRIFSRFVYMQMRLSKCMWNAHTKRLERGLKEGSREGLH